MRIAPVARGTVLAVASALAFGATTPVVASAARSAASFSVASLLYGGAAFGAFGLGLRAAPEEAPLRSAHVPRVIAVSLLGAVVAPVALAWGLARVGATTGALLLNLEAVFTVLLARAAYREPISGRVALALVASTVAGVGLALRAPGGAGLGPAGALAVTLATFAWAADNTATRRLADVRPLSVVAAKAALGASVTAALGVITGGSWPDSGHSAALLAAGAVGYGGSLVLYLRAQRILGAGRTGSIFALAPFAGATLSSAFDHATLEPVHDLAAILFGTSIFLHATERHGHRHHHPRERHEHSHTHDDGHHDHVHEPPVEGEHSHEHSHEELAHHHEHTPDLHHDHAH